ncbi:hypothetical protein JB92DRAFT_3123543 [Gautieria morchelliformis]|nr:hypothetical protein JB92DRAFT_3123543 [Gautieria morchelliformis]
MLMETCVFHVHGIVGDPQFELIKATGRLGAVLWYHELRNMGEYLDDLRVLVANILDAFDAVDSACIIDKGKLHVLVHLPEDVEHFGLAIRYATEVFECFNHVFHMCSILSNHQAPGRDIARKCASMERLKHLASRRVQGMLLQHPIVQTHLGWVPPSKWRQGYIFI